MSMFNPKDLTKAQASLAVSSIAILRDKIIKNELYEYRLGICFNLDRIVEEVYILNSGWFNAYTVVAALAVTWPNSVSPGTLTNYPIKKGSVGLWEGEQLEARLSLLDHIEAFAKSIINEEV